MMAVLGKLRTREQFLYTASEGTSVRTKGFILQAAPSKDSKPSDTAHMGYTASRKVGSAVKRNKAKRRLRALANQYMSLYALEGYDYVLIGKKTTLDRPFGDLRRDLTYALHTLKLHKKSI